MIETNRLIIYPASEEQMEASNIASQRVLEKAGFIPTGKAGEEGPLFARRITIRPEEDKDY